MRARMFYRECPRLPLMRARKPPLMNCMWHMVCQNCLIYAAPNQNPPIVPGHKSVIFLKFSLALSTPNFAVSVHILCDNFRKGGGGSVP